MGDFNKVMKDRHKEAYMDTTIVTDTKKRAEITQKYDVHRIYEQNRKMQSSRYTFLLVPVGGDSPEMTAVKDAQYVLNELLFGQIPEFEDDFEKRLSVITEAYDTLKEKCLDYISKRKHPHTSCGKDRLRLVNGALAFVVKERGQLTEFARKYYISNVLGNENNEPCCWYNILGQMRTEQISVGSKDVYDLHKGRGTSKVYSVGADKDPRQRFFKPDEMLKLAAVEFEKTYLSDKKNKHYNLYKKLLPFCISSKNKSFTGSAYFRHSDIMMSIHEFLELFKDSEKITVEDFKSRIAHSTDNYIKMAAKIFGPALIKMITADDDSMRKFIDALHSAYTLKNREGISFEAGIEEGASLTNRNIATSYLSFLFNIPGLICNTKKADFSVENGKKEGGIIMDKAPGKTISDYMKKYKGHVRYAGPAIEQLSTLQIFDTICGQIDRNGSNYLVEGHEETIYGARTFMITSIQGIDNDISFGKLSFSDINKKGLNRLIPVVKNGLIIMPHMSSSFAHAITNMNDNTVKYLLADLVSEKDIDAFLGRLHAVQNAIIKTAEKKRDFIIDSDKYNEASVQKKFLKSMKRDSSYLVRDLFMEGF